MRNKNVLKRAKIVQQIMEEHYEPGNQSKCQVQVLRTVLAKSYPMSERTMRRYMKINIEQEQKKKDDRQLNLFDGSE
jgi:hypothetical protein